jgi:hypothetical protein
VEKAREQGTYMRIAIAKAIGMKKYSTGTLCVWKTLWLPGIVSRRARRVARGYAQRRNIAEEDADAQREQRRRDHSLVDLGRGRELEDARVASARREQVTASVVLAAGMDGDT